MLITGLISLVALLLMASAIISIKNNSDDPYGHVFSDDAADPEDVVKGILITHFVAFVVISIVIVIFL